MTHALDLAFAVAVAVAIGLAAGGLAGALHFASLRRLTDRLVAGRIGAPALLGWQLLRWAVLLAAGLAVARAGAAALLAFGAGLWLARAAVLRADGRASPRAPR
jgi:F1F0 ATPase subunit 2